MAALQQRMQSAFWIHCRPHCEATQIHFSFACRQWNVTRHWRYFHRLQDKGFMNITGIPIFQCQNNRGFFFFLFWEMLISKDTATYLQSLQSHFLSVRSVNLCLPSSLFCPGISNHADSLRKHTLAFFPRTRDFLF